MIIRRNTAKECLAEVLPMMEAHWKEIGYVDEPLDLDIDMLNAVERMGGLRVFTLEDDRLVGYCAFMVSRTLLQRTVKEASEIGLYVDPLYRKGTTAIRLLNYAERELSAEGVTKFVYHVPPSNQGFAAMLEHRGFSKTDTVYERRQ
tara:strand:- start:121 stop:561 length:441 start_codon:yes stop_codon:yes gene_type:complete